MALRPSQVRRLLQNEMNMPVDDAPEDDAPEDDAPDDEGYVSPRQSYNFAPGYHGIVYRADTPDSGAGPHRANAAGPDAEGQEHDDESVSNGAVKYKLQSMKWGLIPFWTKRNPDYGSMLKTINCRDDSLAAPGGMWASIKGRKRCIVLAQGFYEWLNKGPKEKVPHYTKRKDGQLLCLAGLWDCVQYEGEETKRYTYTIITTSSNKQLQFLHDRMPVIFEPGSEELRLWLSPSRYEWSRDLQTLLKPYEGELECYPVSKEVGKVGNNSPNFIIPVASKENKNNIANFFAKGAMKNSSQSDSDVKQESQQSVETTAGVKRDATDCLEDKEPLKKKTAVMSPLKPSPNRSSPIKPATRSKTSATSNGTKSPSKSKAAGTPKITAFFSK